MDRASIIIATGGVAFTILVAAWDIYCSHFGEGERTVSQVLADWSRAYPFLPFAVGLVMGHLFWR